MSRAGTDLRHWALVPPLSANPSAFARIGMVALLYAHHLVCGWLCALSPARWISHHLAAFPDAGRRLFTPGGPMLVDIYRALRGALPALASQGSAAALIAALLGLYPFAWLVVALTYRGKLHPRFIWTRAKPSIAPLVLLWGATLLLQTSLSLLFILVAERALAALRLSLLAIDLIRVALMLLLLLALSAISAIHDLARILAVSEERGFYMSAALAIAAFQRAPLRIFWAYGVRALAALSLCTAAFIITWPRAFGGSPAWITAAVVSQIAAFMAILLRASWLAYAIAAVRANAVENT